MADRQAELLPETGTSDRIIALREARDAVAAQAERFAASPVFGFHKLQFLFGSVLAYGTIYYFGCCPGDFWKLHLLLFTLLLNIQFYRWAHLGNLCFFVEFCWQANLSIAVYLAVSYFEPSMLSPHLRGVLFRMLFAFAAGPLSMAVVLLHNAMVPHHFDYTLSLMIHLLPLVTAFSIKWDNTNPTLFPAEEFVSFGDYVSPPLAFVSVYAVFHSSFFVFCGLALPQKGYSTTPEFNLNPKRPNVFTRMFGQRQKNGEGETARFLKYETVAIFLIALAIMATYPLYAYGAKTVHLSYLGLLCLGAILNGAEWYEFHLSRFPGVVDALIAKECKDTYGSAA